MKRHSACGNFKLLCGPCSCCAVNYYVLLGCKTQSHFHGSLCGTSEQSASSAEKFQLEELCGVSVCDWIQHGIQQVTSGKGQKAAQTLCKFNLTDRPCSTWLTPRIPHPTYSCLMMLLYFKHSFKTEFLIKLKMLIL